MKTVLAAVGAFAVVAVSWGCGSTPAPDSDENRVAVRLYPDVPVLDLAVSGVQTLEDWVLLGVDRQAKLRLVCLDLFLDPGTISPSSSPKAMLLTTQSLPISEGIVRVRAAKELPAEYAENFRKVGRLLKDVEVRAEGDAPAKVGEAFVLDGVASILLVLPSSAGELELASGDKRLKLPIERRMQKITTGDGKVRPRSFAAAFEVSFPGLQLKRSASYPESTARSWSPCSHLGASSAFTSTRPCILLE